MIADAVGCYVQSLRNTIRAFEAQGTACLAEKPSRPNTTRNTLDENGPAGSATCSTAARVTEPRLTRLWTLALAVEVARAEGLTNRPVSGDAICRRLLPVGVGWKRAKSWVVSLDPADLRRERHAIG